MGSVCIGFKAHLGWLNIVAVEMEEHEPVPVLVRRLDLFEGADRETLEPYHVAGGWKGLTRGARPKNPAAIIKRARQKQDKAVASVFSVLREDLKLADLQWDKAVVLTGRGIVHSLEGSINDHAHVHVAEGEAMREAARFGIDHVGVPRVDQDEKSVLPDAAHRLGTSPEDLDIVMKDLKPDKARNWAKEERLIALAAYLHAAR